MSRCNRDNTASKIPPLILQYTEETSDQLANKLKNVAENPVIFTMRKTKTALPSLESKIPKTLMSRDVYQIECPGCNSSSVGQTTRHLATRLHEHSLVSSHVGSHLLKCGQIMENASVKLLNRSNRPTKLLTLEALHISRLQPGINQKEEYRSREHTLRV